MKLSEFEIGDIVKTQYLTIEYLGKVDTIHGKGKIISSKIFGRSVGSICDNYDLSADWELVKKGKKGDVMNFNVLNCNGTIATENQYFWVGETFISKDSGLIIAQRGKENKIFKLSCGCVLDCALTKNIKVYGETTNTIMVGYDCEIEISGHSNTIFANNGTIIRSKNMEYDNFLVTNPTHKSKFFTLKPNSTVKVLSNGDIEYVKEKSEAEIQLEECQNKMNELQIEMNRLRENIQNAK